MNNVPWYFVLVILTTAQLLVGAADKSRLLDTIFIRYYGKTVNEYVDHAFYNASLGLTQMENNKSTVVYIHGFSESVDSESVITVAKAYIQRGDHNVLAVDYRNISSLNYLRVVSFAPDVGASVGIALNEMVADGLDAERIHIVGHSMGAQVAAHIKDKTTFNITRIVGLDPAGPLFNLNPSRLSSKSAKNVEIIHTDFGFYGTAQTTGTTDFFPNGGHRIQPGCPLLFLPYSNEDFCSHHRSWRFYAESLIDEGAFIGLKCSSEFLFNAGLCKNNEKVVMGYATPADAKGTFYLVTRAESPFGLKENGTRTT